MLLSRPWPVLCSSICPSIFVGGNPSRLAPVVGESHGMPATGCCAFYILMGDSSLVGAVNLKKHIYGSINRRCRCRSATQATKHGDLPCMPDQRGQRRSPLSAAAASHDDLFGSRRSGSRHLASYRINSGTCYGPEGGLQAVDRRHAESH
jgi:hypothetical protein